MIIRDLPPGVLKAALNALGPGEPPFIFEEGEIVEGRVIKTISDKQAVVRLGGVEMVALTASKLAEGQSIVGRVERVHPNITVSLLRGETTRDVKTSELIRLLMPGKAAIGDSLAKAVEAARMDGLSPRARGALEAMARDVSKALSLDMANITPEKIRDAMKNSGLFLEGALRSAVEGAASKTDLKAALEADIKSILGRAASEVEKEIARIAREADAAAKSAAGGGKAPGEGKEAKQDAAHPLLEELARTRHAAKEVREAINNIELNQLLNSVVKEKGGASADAPAMYQLPFASEGMIHTARLYIKPREGGADKKAKKGKSESRIVFMLSMSRLGAVRVDINAAPGRITGIIYVENEKAAAHARERLPGLIEPLKAAGFDTWIEVAAAGREFLTEELENRVPIIAGGGLISVRA